MLTIFHRRLALISILIVLIVSCDLENNVDLPTSKTSNLLSEIKKVEYESVFKLREKIKELENLKDSSSNFYAKYYTLKANFLQKYNLKTVEEFNSIYPELKKRELFKLMAEIDILSTMFYYKFYNYAKASEFAERSFEYCFTPEMFLERQGLIYGISPTAILNSSKQKKEEIEIVLKEIEDYPWSYYHSRILRNLGLTNYYLKDYTEAERVLKELIDKNKKNNFIYELAYTYQIYALIRHRITGDYNEYIKYQKKSIELKKNYGHNFRVINYRLIGHEYFYNKRFKDATEYYKKATESVGRDSASMSVDFAYLGWAHININPKENFNKANEYYDKALSYTTIKKTGYKIALERKIWSLRSINRNVEADKYKIKLLEAQNVNYKTDKENKLQDFRINTILSLKSKNQNLKQLEFINHIQESKLETQKLLNIAYALFTVMFFVLLYLFFINRKNLLKIKELNTQLQKSLQNIESINKTLESKNKEVTRLLELNERSLFAKVLKLSTYKDAIENINIELSNIIYGEKEIKPNSLFSIENKLKSMFSEKEIWEDFKIQFEKTRPDFFYKLKDTIPDLSINDLKHCSYITSNLKTKEVAHLINVSPRSVETVRYRLKKKLKLSKEESLYDYLQNI